MQFHKVNNSQYELTMNCKLWQFNLPHFTKNTRHNFFANKIPTTIYNLQVALLNLVRLTFHTTIKDFVSAVPSWGLTVFIWTNWVKKHFIKMLQLVVHSLVLDPIPFKGANEGYIKEVRSRFKPPTNDN